METGVLDEQRVPDPPPRQPAWRDPDAAHGGVDLRPPDHPGQRQSKSAKCCTPIHGSLQQSSAPEYYIFTDPRPGGVVAADHGAIVKSKLHWPDMGPDRDPD